MIGCLRTCRHVRKQPIIALNFESENELKFYNLEVWFYTVNLESFIYALRGHRLDFPNKDVLHILVSDAIVCHSTHLGVSSVHRFNQI